MRKNIGAVLAVIMSIAMLYACLNSYDFLKSVTDNSTQITEMTTALQDDEIDEVTSDNKEVTDTTVKEKEKTTKQNKTIINTTMYFTINSNFAIMWYRFPCNFHK